MLTAAGYTDFCATAMERAAAKTAALVRRDRYGCCDHGGANQYVVEIVTYGERGQFLSRTVEVKCHLTGQPCPAGQLGLLVSLYGILNRRTGNGDWREGDDGTARDWVDPRGGIQGDRRVG